MSNKRPLQAGDVCRVVGALGQSKSPNVGKIVTVRHRVFGAHGGDHSVHGPVYRCDGEEVYQLSDGGGYINLRWADFAGSWLERIDPEELKKQDEVTKSVEA